MVDKSVESDLSLARDLNSSHEGREIFDPSLTTQAADSNSKLKNLTLSPIREVK